MIVVTGAAGFIGSNLVAGLNQRGETNILAVDDLTDGAKFVNLVDCEIADYLDKDEFLRLVEQDKLPPIEAISHQGACSTTTEWDGRFMMDINYRYSKCLLHYAETHDIPLIYASSAAVYGDGAQGFREEPECEGPLNVYGYSKLLFDRYVRRKTWSNQVVGLRYFNVYGPREQHKGGMASTAFHFNNQIEADGECRLFEGCDGYADGEQRRDFIHVDDVVAVNLWFFDQPSISGVFNCGTGRAQPFNDVADAVLAWHGRGEKRYISFPEKLRGRYQSFTEADLSRLRAAGYDAPFATVDVGVRRYLDSLHA